MKKITLKVPICLLFSIVWIYRFVLFLFLSSLFQLILKVHITPANFSFYYQTPDGHCIKITIAPSFKPPVTLSEDSEHSSKKDGFQIGILEQQHSPTGYNYQPSQLLKAPHKLSLWRLFISWAPSTAALTYFLPLSNFPAYESSS